MQSWVTLEHALLLVYLSCVARGQLEGSSLVFVSYVPGLQSIVYTVVCRVPFVWCVQSWCTDEHHHHSVTTFLLFQRSHTCNGGMWLKGGAFGLWFSVVSSLMVSWGFSPMWKDGRASEAHIKTPLDAGMIRLCEGGQVWALIAATTTNAATLPVACTILMPRKSKKAWEVN